MTPTWAESPDLSTRRTRMKSRLQPRPKSASTSGSMRHAAGTTASSPVQLPKRKRPASSSAAGRAKKEASSGTGSVVRRQARKRAANAAIKRSTEIYSTNMSASSSSSSSSMLRPKSAGPVRALRNRNAVPVARLHDMTAAASYGSENSVDGSAAAPRRGKRRARPSTATGGRGSSSGKRKKRPLAGSTAKQRPQSAAAGRPKTKASLSASAGSVLGRGRRRRRPLSSTAASSSVAGNVRTSFPPVISQAKIRQQRGKGAGGLGLNGWMDTGTSEKIPSYNALEDRFCPLYKPKNLVRGRKIDKGSPKYKMAQWRKKYNADLKRSLADRKEHIELQRGVQEDKGIASASHQASAVLSVGAADSFPFPADAGQMDSIMHGHPSDVSEGMGPHARSSSRSPSPSSTALSPMSKMLASSTNITYAQDMAPSPSKTNSKNRLIDTPTRNQIRAKGAGASISRTKRSRKKSKFKTKSGHKRKGPGESKPGADQAPVGMGITYEDDGGRGSGSLGSANMSHSQDEVQVVKSILHRERLVQLCRSAVTKMEPLDRIHALLDRVRSATVETVEAVQRWNVGEEKRAATKAGGRQRRTQSFKWHAKNYLIDLCSDLDSLHFASAALRASVGFDLRRNPLLLPGLPPVDDTSVSMLSAAMQKFKLSEQGEETNVSPRYAPGNHHDIDIKRVLAAETALLKEEELVLEGGKHRGRMVPDFLLKAHAADASENSLRRVTGSQMERMDKRVARHYAKKAKRRRRKKKGERGRNQSPALSSTSPTDTETAACKEDERRTPPRATSGKKKKMRRNRRAKKKKKKKRVGTHSKQTKSDPRPWRIKKPDPPDPAAVDRLRQEGLKQWERIFGLNKQQEQEQEHEERRRRLADTSGSDYDSSDLSSSSGSESDSVGFSSGSDEMSSDIGDDGDAWGHYASPKRTPVRGSFSSSSPSSSSSSNVQSSPKSHATPASMRSSGKKGTPPPGTPISARLRAANGDTADSENKSPLGNLTDWERYYDDDEGTFYFYNAVIGRSSWVRPRGWKTPARGSRAPLPSVPRDETTNWAELKHKSPAKQRRGVWTEHVDLETGAYWYWNNETGESTWEPPVDWGVVEDEYGRSEAKENTLDEIAKQYQEEEQELERQSQRVVEASNAVTLVSPPSLGSHHPDNAHTDWEHLKVVSPVHRRRGEWTQHFDENNQAYWYEHFDEKTGNVTCTWDMPEDWIAEDVRLTPGGVAHRMRDDIVEENLDAQTDWGAVRARSPIKRRHGVWTEHFDKESGAYWYHNGNTDESTWDSPEEWNDTWNVALASHQGREEDWEQLRLKSPAQRHRGEWIEHLDGESGAYWYHNSTTGESTWDQPLEFQTHLIKGGGEMEGAKDGATGTTRDAPRASSDGDKNSVEHWEKLKVTSPMKRRCGDWIEHLDEASGKFWYQNNATGHSQWERPDEWNAALPATDADTDWAKLKLQSPVRSRRGEWIEHYDEESGAYWYENEATGVTTWEPPPGWQTAPSADAVAAGKVTTMTADELQYWTDVRKTSKVKRKLDAFWTEWKDEGDTQSLWYSKSDVAHQNDAMVECTWNKPDVVENTVTDEEISAASETGAEEAKSDVLPAHLQTNWAELRASSPLRQRRSSLDQLFDWSEHLDENSGAYWYYNNRTGESSWEQPKGWAAYSQEPVDPTSFQRETATDSTKSSDSSTEGAAGDDAEKQEHWNKLPSDDATNWERLAVTSPLRRVVGAWEEHYDPESRCYWYYNRTTDESSWHQPAHWTDVAVHANTSDTSTPAAAIGANAGQLPKGWPRVSGDNNATDWEVVGLVSPAESRNDTESGSAWHKMMDPVSQCPWWYNNTTGEKTWHEPERWQEHVAKSTAKKKQRELRHSQRKKKRARKRLKKMRERSSQPVRDIEDDSDDDEYGDGSFEKDDADWNEMMSQSPVATRVFGNWEEHVDKKTGHPWWYNAETHVSSWDVPEEVRRKLGERQRRKVVQGGSEAPAHQQHRLAEAKMDSHGMVTPSKKVIASDAKAKDVAMSPAYNDLLADVRSLRESLRVAETELHILAQKTPTKEKVASAPAEQGSPVNAVTLARAEVRAQKVAGEVARIEARMQRVSEREREFLDRVEGRGDIGSRAERHKNSHSDKKKKKKKKKRKKRSKDKVDRVEGSKEDRWAAESSPLSASKYRSARATQSIARAVAAVEFAASPHAADAYVIHAALGSATKKPLPLKKGSPALEDEDQNQAQEDTPRFGSVHKLCNDAISFASSLRFGDHMDAPTMEGVSSIREGQAGAKPPLQEVANAAIAERNDSAPVVGKNWKEQARGNALAQINKKLTKHEAKKLSGEYEREHRTALGRKRKEPEKIEGLAVDADADEEILSRDGLTQAEMEAKLAALQIEMMRTAKMIDHDKRLRAREDEEEKRYRQYAGAVTLQTQWRGWSSRRRVDQLRGHTAVTTQVTKRKSNGAVASKDTLSQTWSQHRVSLARTLEGHAATKVQAHARRRLARKKVVEARLEQRESRLRRLEYVSARMIQSVFRGYSQRQHFAGWKDTRLKPVVAVQAEWRRFSASRRYRAEQLAQAQEVQQAGIRAARDREVSVLAMQSAYRGHLARRMIGVENEAACDLQRVWRGKRCRVHIMGMIEENAAATSVQSQWRRRQQQTQFRSQLTAHNEEKAAVLMQSQSRALLARRRVKRKRQAAKYRDALDQDARERAAINIQATVRGRYERKLYQDVLHAKNACATRVQSLYRGHLSRRLLTIYFVAAIRIQRFWKGKALRLKWRRRALDPITLVKAEKLLTTELVQSNMPGPTNGGGQLLRRAVDVDGNNALMLAARAGSVRVVRICLTKGFDPTTKNTSERQTALHLAASGGGERTEIALMLIRAGADVAALDSLGRSVAHVAAASGNEGVLKMLCDRGVPLEITDRVAGGRTPLHCAAYFGRSRCCEILLYAGANVHVRSTTGGTTPLHTAAARGGTEVVHLLAENEAELDAIDLGGNTPLHLACAGGHAMAVRTMLEFAADTSIANRSGDTAAHFAASMGREECIHLLLDYNLDLAHARNLAGSTPMQAARSTGQVRLVKAIQQRLQVRANELNPPTQIASTPTQVDGAATSNDEQTARTLHSPPSMLSVTEEIDPFEDQWSVPGPPPTHSPPSTSGQELVQGQQRQQVEDVDAVKEALRRRPGDRADISSDSESDDDLLGNAVMAPVAVLPSTGHIAEDYGDGYWDQNKSGQHEQYHEHWGEEVATQAEVVSAEDATTVPVWQEMYDDHHQAVYYLDTVSGHSQWERPHDFVAGAGTAEVVDEDGVDHDSYREDLSNETWSARYDYVDEKDNDIPPPPKNPPERELSFSM